MKNHFYKLVIVFTIFNIYFSNAQSFTNTNSSAIPDNNTLTFYSITVSGLPTIIDSVNFGLHSICLNINHPYDANLDIYLKSPDGQMIKLINNRGANGKNFINTCFKENGTIAISQGVAAFTGSFIPEETINKLNNGQNPNGIWQVGIHDEIPYNAGTLLNFTLLFGNNPPPTPLETICSVTNGLACKCPDGTQDCDLLPDITNSEKVIDVNYIEFNGSLKLGIGTPNIGFGPLEVRGTSNCYCDTVKVPCSTIICPNGSKPKQEVAQRVYHKSGSTITYTDRPAGFMQYHPEHGHIHLDDWTYNSLRLAGPPGSNPLNWPLVGTDKKVSFCLVNLSDCNAIDGACKDKTGKTLTFNDAGNPGMGIVTGCGLEQGIYPGYMDIYYPGYDGQDIFLGNICNGWYNVVSVTDPKHLMKEMDTTNNTAIVPVFLFQQQGDCCHTAFAGDSLIGTAPFTVQFADQSMPMSSKWSWNFGDGATSKTAFPLHTYTQPGVYDVSLKTDSKDTNCKDSLVKKRYITVRKASTESNPFNINVYPNPFNNSAKVYYQLLKSHQVQLSYYDIAGRKLLTQSAQTIPAGLHEEILLTEKLPKGIILLEVAIDGYKKIIKILKQ